MRLTKRDEETIFLILKIYYMYSGVGGELHIVLDDDNVDNGSILFCIDEIMKIEDRMERITYHMCASNLLKMSEKKRLKLIRFCDTIMTAVNKQRFAKYTAKVIEKDTKHSVEDLING